MNVPFQVRLPVGVAVETATKLKQVQTIHGRRAKAEPNSDVIREASKKLSAANVVRLATLVGLDILLRESPEDLYARISEHGAARGRPRRVA